MAAAHPAAAESSATAAASASTATAATAVSEAPFSGAADALAVCLGVIP
jgi:hypothetical protein